jgi:hypothetical protein
MDLLAGAVTDPNKIDRCRRRKNFDKCDGWLEAMPGGMVCVETRLPMNPNEMYPLRCS